MICEVCDRLGQCEGDPPQPADVVVRVLMPWEAARENPLQRLCTLHAQQAVAAFIGFGWNVYVGRRCPDERELSRVS